MKITNYLQPRLVDDITLLPEVIKPGMRFENDTLVYHKDKEDEDNLVADDIRTMKIIQTVANTIDESISVSFDVPSMNEDNRVPVLDVKMCVNSYKQVEYIFYKKPITNNMLTHKDSALSMKSKFTIQTQECFRRLHNTSEFISNEMKVEILNELMRELKYY